MFPDFPEPLEETLLPIDVAYSLASDVLLFILEKQICQKEKLDHRVLNLFPIESIEKWVSFLSHASP